MGKNAGPTQFPGPRAHGGYAHAVGAYAGLAIVVGIVDAAIVVRAGQPGQTAAGDGIGARTARNRAASRNDRLGLAGTQGITDCFGGGTLDALTDLAAIFIGGQAVGASDLTLYGRAAALGWTDLTQAVLAALFQHLGFEAVGILRVARCAVFTALFVLARIVGWLVAERDFVGAAIIVDFTPCVAPALAFERLTIASIQAGAG